MLPNLVSTILPVYNRSAMLREAVDCVLAQTHRPIEILIVDDGSTDDTPAVCEEIRRAHADCVQVVTRANGGPGLARESGRLAAQGEFIQHLDSDDYLAPTKFERQVAALQQSPESDVAYCYTRFRRMGEPPAEVPWKRTGISVETMFPTFLLARWWETVTPLYRKGILDRAGPWTDLRLEEDWEYDCRIASLGARLVHVPEFLAEHRDHALERLSRGAALDPVRLRYRARAHELIDEHAIRAGIEAQEPSRRHFTRELFLLSRQCGAAGLVAESKMLFRRARAASGQEGARAWDFRLYQIGARLVGWRNAGRFSCWMDRFRANGDEESLATS